MPARVHPTRTCVACRTPRQKRELVRVVRTPGGAIVLDPSGRAPGRGAYVCADAACQAAAMTKGVLRRALAVPIPAGLFDPSPAIGAAAPSGATAPIGATAPVGFTEHLGAAEPVGAAAPLGADAPGMHNQDDQEGGA